MPIISDDYQWMSRAMQLAARGRYTAKPNPCVGCVIVNNDILVGEGWHHRAGSAHAEVNAIVHAGAQTHGATAYITLEPCNHQGRTGPCTQALIKAGVARVVFAMLDSNPLVSGQGVETLKKAGVVVDGPLSAFQQAARDLNIGFIRRMERQRPWVRCKVAMSLDGRTALANGESQWITGSAARSDGQRWRARSSAVVTGINSILHDNSRLSLRQEELGLPGAVDVESVLSLAPLRVVLDTHLRIPLDAAILEGNASTLLLTSDSTIRLQSEKVEKIKACGPHISVEALPVNNAGQLCLQQLLTLLAQKECNEVLVEAGATLAGAFLKAELIDEFIIYQAPILLGSDARSMLDFSLSRMAEKWQLNITDRRQIGGDQRIIARIESQANSTVN